MPAPGEAFDDDIAVVDGWGAGGSIGEIWDQVAEGNCGDDWGEAWWEWDGRIGRDGWKGGRRGGRDDEDC